MGRLSFRRHAKPPRWRAPWPKLAPSHPRHPSRSRPTSAESFRPCVTRALGLPLRTSRNAPASHHAPRGLMLSDSPNSGCSRLHASLVGTATDVRPNRAKRREASPNAFTPRVTFSGHAATAETGSANAKRSPARPAKPSGQARPRSTPTLRTASQRRSICRTRSPETPSSAPMRRSDQPRRWRVAACSRRFATAARLARAKGVGMGGGEQSTFPGPVLFPSCSPGRRNPETGRCRASANC